MTKQTWKIPDPPGPEIQTLIDMEGHEWTRACKDGSMWHDQHGQVSWDGLVYNYGPLTHE